jgi:hypothetical protein
MSTPRRKDMRLRKLHLVVVCVLLVLVASTFEPLPVEAATTITGTFVFNFNITIASNISTSTTIACGGILTVSGDAATPSIYESQNANATRSGNTATCTFTIPYSWNLATPTTDKVSITWAIEAPAFMYGIVPYRSSQDRLPDISVPANGATTTETINATI